MKSSKIIISSIFIFLPLAQFATAMDEMEMETQRLANGGAAYRMRSESSRIEEDQRGTRVLVKVGEESRRTKHFVARCYISQPTPQSVYVDYLSKVYTGMIYIS